MKKLLWLDDIRNPYLADWLMQYAPEWDDDRDNVVWVVTYKQFCDWITENGLPDTIAFDHDLSDFQSMKTSFPDIMDGIKSNQSEKTGMDCAKWLVDYCLDNNVKLPKWEIQSANPAGRDNINGLLNNFKNFKND